MTHECNDDDLIDGRRTVRLADVGCADYVAAAAIKPDGSEHLVLARLDQLGDDTASGYDADCPQATHEQLGPLPLEFVRRLTISRRRSRRGSTEGSQ